jgi:hypothetical protein
MDWFNLIVLGITLILFCALYFLDRQTGKLKKDYEELYESTSLLANINQVFLSWMVNDSDLFLYFMSFCKESLEMDDFELFKFYSTIKMANDKFDGVLDKDLNIDIEEKSGTMH